MLFGKVVRTSCPICGGVDVRGGQVMILSGLEAEQNFYAFFCPKCASPIVKQASGSIVALLLRAGAQVGSWPSPNRGPITDDEQIDFHQWLARLPTAER
jgi:hypothetical protein